MGKQLNLPMEKICNDYLCGMSASKIAKQYNCVQQTIINRLRKNGINIRSLSEIQKGKEKLILPTKEICDKYINGMDTVELAEEYGCSIPVIRYRLKKNNITIRSRSEVQEGRKRSVDERKHISAGRRNIPYDEWESFASEQLYCPNFNEECKESNRDKYDRRCFLSDLLESENITLSGKQHKLSVHHVDMDKMQGCDGKKWKLVPLTKTWHSRAHHEPWKSRIIWLLNNVW